MQWARTTARDALRLSRGALGAFVWSVVAGSLALTPTNNAGAVTLQLVPPSENSNSFELELSVGILSSSDTSDGVGTVDVEFEHRLDGDDAVITGVEFTGGRIEFGEVEFVFPLLLQISGSDIAATMDTLAPSPVVDGEFDAAAHQLTVNEGVFVSTGLAEQTIDISTMPFGGPGSGTGSVVATESVRTATSVTYETTVTLPVAFVGAVQDRDNGDPIDADLDLSGTIVATGDWTVALSAPGDLNNDGVVDAADYTVWRDGLGASYGASDYKAWRAGYGAAAPGGGATATAAPEPIAGALAVLGLGLISARRRRAVLALNRAAGPGFASLSALVKVRTGHAAQTSDRF